MAQPVPKTQKLVYYDDTWQWRVYQGVLVFMIIGPFVALGLAIAYFGGRPVDLWGILFAGTIAHGLGVTLVLHRFLTHESFETGTVMKVIFMAFAGMAVEGYPINWVSDHRQHHENSDTEWDLHSPWRNEELSWKGLFFAHIRWMFVGKAGNVYRYAPKLLADPIIRIMSNLFPFWVLLSFVYPALIGGAWEYYFGNPEAALWGAWQGFLWGFVRVGVVHHITWAVNSAGHAFGDMPYVSSPGDQSRNVPWWFFALPLFTLGEIHHRNHHAFPWSARHGHVWWGDPTYMVIKGLELSGLVWGLKLPTEEQLASKRLNREVQQAA